jgi:23S rRNA A2030 N6-methylase RlmJ
MNEITEYELTQAEAATLQEYTQGIAELNQQHQGALRMIARQQGLLGAWDLQGTKLVKKQEATT